MPPVPFVQISKVSSNLGSVGPSSTGNLAIIAPAAAGPIATPSTWLRTVDALAVFGLGELIEDADIALRAIGKPVLLIRGTGTTAASYSAVTFTGGGTLVPTAGSSVPLDDYNVIVEFTAAGAVSTPGIMYIYTLDGGLTWSPPQSLGGSAVSISLNVPRLNVPSGVSFNLPTTETVEVGDLFTCIVTGPRLTNGDVSTALAALGATEAPWDAVLIAGIAATSSLIAIVEAWLESQELVGQFATGFLNSRHKVQSAPTVATGTVFPMSESEATFLAAMATAFSGSVSLRCDVGTDAAYAISSLTTLRRTVPPSLAAACSTMANPPGVDPAFVGKGAIPGWQLSDDAGNPSWHNENFNPGLDALRLTSLRTVPGQIGVFITNSNMLSEPGSDYVFSQQAQCMNVACTIAFKGLTLELSKGVGKQPPNPPPSGPQYILETDADAIEEFINPSIAQALKGQVVGADLALARNDDLSSNSGATVHGTVEVESLAYIKGFAVQAMFTKTITVASP